MISGTKLSSFPIYTPVELAARAATVKVVILGSDGTSVIGNYLTTLGDLLNYIKLQTVFSTGLTVSGNNVTANLSTGVSGGQTIIGGTASGNNLTLSSTSHATKGNFIFGSTSGMVYNEPNARLRIGQATDNGFKLDVGGTLRATGVITMGSGAVVNTNQVFYLDQASAASLTSSAGGGDFHISTSTSGYSINFRNGTTILMSIGSKYPASIGFSTIYAQECMRTTGMAKAIVASNAPKTSAYTATRNDHIICCDATSASFIVTLPTSGINIGQEYTIKKLGGTNTVTVDPSGSVNIDSAANVALTVDQSSVTVVWDGVKYLITGKYL